MQNPWSKKSTANFAKLIGDGGATDSKQPAANSGCLLLVHFSLASQFPPHLRSKLRLSGSYVHIDPKAGRQAGRHPISSSLPLALLPGPPAGNSSTAHLRCLTLGPPANNSSRTGSNANHLHFSTFLTTQYLHPTGPSFFLFSSNEQWILLYCNFLLKF
jgi:hypothetical protein